MSKHWDCNRHICTLYLVHVVFRDGVIECSVEIVEEVDDLHRSALRRQGCEADDVWEVDGHAAIHTRLHLATSLQLVCYETGRTKINNSLIWDRLRELQMRTCVEWYSLWKHLLQEHIGFLLLFHQFTSSLLDNTLQIIGILLQFVQHVINDVQFPTKPVNFPINYKIVHGI